MKYSLTILCPGIRTANWERLYRSVETSFSGSWEIIFIGPQDIPEDFKSILWGEGKDNFKFIQDWGSPIRCQQIGLAFAQGAYINWAADDGFFLPGALDEGFKLLQGYDYKTVLMGKYQEGPRLNDNMEKDWYYILSNHDSMKLPGVTVGFYMLNLGLVSTQLLKEVGGWDAQNFEVCPMAYNDLAIRLQNYGCPFIVQDKMMFSCSHMPGHEGDHGPIHDAQIYFDQPRFSEIYSDPNCKSRAVIDIENWRNAPDKWSRRFGK